MDVLHDLVRYDTRRRKAKDPQEVCFCTTAIVQLLSMRPEYDAIGLFHGIIFVDEEESLCD